LIKAQALQIGPGILKFQFSKVSDFSVIFHANENPIYILVQ